MAKLIKTYENGIEKFELTFLGETYDYSMIPNDYGATGDKPTFDTQIAKRHPELKEKKILMERLDSISFEDDGGDLAKIVKSLSRWE